MDAPKYLYVLRDPKKSPGGSEKFVLGASSEEASLIARGYQSADASTYSSGEAKKFISANNAQGLADVEKFRKKSTDGWLLYDEGLKPCLQFVSTRLDVVRRLSSGEASLPTTEQISSWFEVKYGVLVREHIQDVHAFHEGPKFVRHASESIHNAKAALVIGSWSSQIVPSPESLEKMLSDCDVVLPQGFQQYCASRYAELILEVLSQVSGIGYVAASEDLRRAHVSDCGAFDIIRATKERSKLVGSAELGYLTVRELAELFSRLLDDVLTPMRRAASFRLPSGAVEREQGAQSWQELATGLTQALEVLTQETVRLQGLVAIRALNHGDSFDGFARALEREARGRSSLATFWLVVHYYIVLTLLFIGLRLVDVELVDTSKKVLGALVALFTPESGHLLLVEDPKLLPIVEAAWYCVSIALLLAIGGIFLGKRESDAVGDILNDKRMADRFPQIVDFGRPSAGEFWRPSRTRLLVRWILRRVSTSGAVVWVRHGFNKLPIINRIPKLLDRDRRSSWGFSSALYGLRTVFFVTCVVLSAIVTAWGAPMKSESQNYEAQLKLIEEARKFSGKDETSKIIVQPWVEGVSAKYLVRGLIAICALWLLVGSRTAYRVNRHHQTECARRSRAARLISDNLRSCDDPELAKQIVLVAVGEVSRHAYSRENSGYLAKEHEMTHVPNLTGMFNHTPVGKG